MSVEFGSQLGYGYILSYKHMNKLRSEWPECWYYEKAINSYNEHSNFFVGITMAQAWSGGSARIGSHLIAPVDFDEKVGQFVRAAFPDDAVAEKPYFYMISTVD